MEKITFIINFGTTQKYRRLRFGQVIMTTIHAFHIKKIINKADLQANIWYDRNISEFSPKFQATFYTPSSGSRGGPGARAPPGPQI